MPGIGYERTTSIGSIPVFQGTGKDISVVQGGFLLVITGLVLNSIIPAGTPMIYDETARTAAPLRTGKIYEAAASNATSYKIYKGSPLKVGDNFAKTKGDKAYPITSIDTSNNDYDVVTVGTTIGATVVGDFVFASTATGATNAALGAINGLLYRDTFVKANESVSVVDRAKVYARRVPYSADIAAALPRITYSQSY